MKKRLVLKKEIQDDLIELLGAIAMFSLAWLILFIGA